MRVKVPVVPASFFGMVLGLAGLGAAWRWAHQVWGLPAVVGEAIIWLSIAVWAGLTILYVAKWSVARDDASAEVADPVQCCFVGLIGVATILVAAGIQPYSPALAVILFTAGAAFAVGFAVWRTGGLWQGEREHAATTAVLYLPTVAGGFVTAITAAALGHADWGQVIFGGGLFSWLAIESVLLGRMLTGPELAAALRPTLGIQLAPAPVGAVAYLSVTQGPPDVFAHALIGYGVLQSLILLRLLPWIGAGGFTPSYWAFTFGITALAMAPLKLLARGDSGAIADLAGILFGAANLAVAAVMIGTVLLAMRGKLFAKTVAFPLLAHRSPVPVTVGSARTVCGPPCGRTAASPALRTMPPRSPTSSKHTPNVTMSNGAQPAASDSCGEVH